MKKTDALTVDPRVTVFLKMSEQHPDLGLNTMLGSAEKLGDKHDVRAWNLSPEKTCRQAGNGTIIAASRVCRSRCYYSKMCEGRPRVADRAERNCSIAELDCFDIVLTGAIIQAEVKKVRLHDFGDFFSLAYIKAITKVVDACPGVHFWAYTRAWRKPEYVEPLTKLASFSNMSLLLSADRETGIPFKIENTKVAWLADTDFDIPPEKVHVVFRATSERVCGVKPCLKTMGESRVCLLENGEYLNTEANGIQVRGNSREKPKKVGPKSCVNCRICLFKVNAGSDSTESTLLDSSKAA